MAFDTPACHLGVEMALVDREELRTHCHAIKWLVGAEFVEVVERNKL